MVNLMHTLSTKHLHSYLSNINILCQQRDVYTVFMEWILANEPRRQRTLDTILYAVFDDLVLLRWVERTWQVWGGATGEKYKINCRRNT